jgi:hypothetical protein
MRTLISFLFIVVCIGISNAQSLYFEYGFNRPRSFLETPMEYSYSNFEEQNETMCIGFEHCISKKLNLSLNFDYLFKYLSGAGIVIKNPESPFGMGVGITVYKTFGSGLKYTKNIFNNHLHLSPGLFFKVVNVQRSNKDSIKRYLEDYHYKGVFYPIAYPGTYFVPEIRLAIGVRFLTRMHFYLNMAYARGFSKTQDIVWEYSYKGVPQPKAVAYVNGTELRFHIGLKVDLVRCNKKEIEAKSSSYKKKKRKYK